MGKRYGILVTLFLLMLCLGSCSNNVDGFDHGVGHSLLLLYDAKASYSQKSKYFNGLGHYPFNALYKFILN